MAVRQVAVLKMTSLYLRIAYIPGFRESNGFQIEIGRSLSENPKHGREGIESALVSARVQLTMKMSIYTPESTQSGTEGEGGLGALAGPSWTNVVL